LSVRGVFHQEYVELHAKVAQLQQTEKVIIIRGDGGEAEVSADKNIPILMIEKGVITEHPVPATDIDRPIAETLMVDEVARRLLSVLREETADEIYGKTSLTRTLAIITT
jgi:anthranilate phosphoribosyltransferase